MEWSDFLCVCVCVCGVSSCLDVFNIKPEFQEFLNENNIYFQQIDVGFNQEPFLVMNEEKVQEVLAFALNPVNQPILLLCKDGKVCNVIVLYIH